MEFLAPLMLLGLAGAAVPVAIHLIGRRRAPVRRFGAIDFLFGENRRVARRLQLREILLLAVRVAATLAIPLVLAKPFLSCASHGPVIERGPQAVAIVLDNSLVMSARLGDDTLFEEAKRRAVRLLHDLGQEADVAVFLAAEGSEVPVDLSRDHLKLRDTIEDAPLVERPADLRRALRSAAGLLSGSPHATRRVYLVSAMTRGGLPPGDPPWGPEAGLELQVTDVTDGKPLPNLALVGARAEPDSEVGPRGLRIVAELVNFGPAAVKDREVTLRMGGRAVARGLVSAGPGETVSKRFSVTTPPETHAAEVVLELEPDALGADDRRFLYVALRSEVRILVVDGDPRTVRREDETFYLETALRPGDRADSAMAVAIVTADDLPRRRLADHDVVFLCNVKALDAERATELEAWVKQGGGLFVSLGDNVKADDYNRTMGGLLAQELRAPRAAAAPGATKVEKLGRADRLARIDVTHPILSVFPAGASALDDARFNTVYLVGPTTRMHDRRTLARFASGAPALVEARLGKGRILLWTSTIDRDWTDFPIHPGFLPLVQQAARYLARAPSREQERDLFVGRAHRLEVAAGDRRVEITAPGGAKTVLEEDRLQGRSEVRFHATDEPGFFRVSAVTGEGDMLRPRHAAEFAVNLDPRASDTTKITRADLPGGAATAAGTGAPASTPRRRVELWHALAVALLLFLLGESILTR